MKKIHIIWVILLLISFSSNAQNSLYQKKEFISKGDTLLYRVMFPENYNSSIKYPLVVFLHGSGERGNDSWVTLNEMPNDKFDIIDTKQPTKALLLVKKLIDSYQKNEAIDSKRVYILGLSLGGMGTFDLICRYPKTFAAAIPICGGVNVERLHKARKISIRIYNGGNDNLVSPDYSRSAYIKLKANGAKNVQHIEFPGVGHDSWTSAFAEPDFLKWLFAQNK
ncbi:MAG: prolyl oligopeptidase family serine peptidase [Paludibacter sp.]|nr:prolyl oligopeptidase family serine peptidase [Paludibacter sp.]